MSYDLRSGKKHQALDDEESSDSSIVVTNSKDFRNMGSSNQVSSRRSSRNNSSRVNDNEEDDTKDILNSLEKHSNDSEKFMKETITKLRAKMTIVNNYYT